MRTARSLPYRGGVSVTETPLDRDPLPLDGDHPPGETEDPPVDRQTPVKA